MKTLHQIVVGAGWKSLAQFARDAGVPVSVVQQANRGTPMGDVSAALVLATLRSRKVRLSSDELVDLIQNGARDRIRTARDRIVGSGRGTR